MVSDSYFNVQILQSLFLVLVDSSNSNFILSIPWEFFTSALADGLSLESEWQQVFSSLQDSSQYSGRSQQCRSLGFLKTSFYFQVL